MKKLFLYLVMFSPLTFITGCDDSCCEVGNSVIVCDCDPCECDPCKCENCKCEDCPGK